MPKCINLRVHGPVSYENGGGRKSEYYNIGLTMAKFLSKIQYINISHVFILKLNCFN